MGEGIEPQESAAVARPQGVEEAQQPHVSRWTRLRHEISLLAKDVGVAAALCVLILLYVARPFTVEGTSMLPTLESGQRIIVNLFVYRVSNIQRGDIVVFYYPLDPSKSFIKRVIGLPGDTVEVDDGYVYVNGEKFRDLYVPRRYREHETLSPVRVQMGHYWVLGDHRNGSNDSRAGWQVPQKYIYGKAFFRYWPPRSVGLLD
ncbi:MAG: signal peptidase I [Acidobacteriota bacterium]